MPRFGIQSEISSDNGSVFIQKTEKCGAAVMHQTAIRLNLPSSVTRNGGQRQKLTFLQV